jgi:hypothetical protein
MNRRMSSRARHIDTGRASALLAGCFCLPTGGLEQNHRAAKAPAGVTTDALSLPQILRAAQFRRLQRNLLRLAS